MLYANLKAIQRFNSVRRVAWNRPRVLKLCAMLQTTPEALSDMIGWSAASMKTALKRGIFPGPVCYIFEVWEQYALRTIGEPAANPCFDPVTPVKLALLALRRMANGTCQSPSELAAKVLEHFPPQPTPSSTDPTKQVNDDKLQDSRTL